MADTLDDLFEGLTPRARTLAEQAGCVLDSKRPVLFECADQPLEVKADAEAAAKLLSVRLAITHAHYYGRVSRLVEASEVKGILGFATDGTPKLCVVHEIVQVEMPGYGEFVATYLGLAGLYWLRSNGSAAPHKP